MLANKHTALGLKLRVLDHRVILYMGDYSSLNSPVAGVRSDGPCQEHEASSFLQSYSRGAENGVKPSRLYVFLHVTDTYHLALEHVMVNGQHQQEVYHHVNL